MPCWKSRKVWNRLLIIVKIGCIDAWFGANLFLLLTAALGKVFDRQTSIALSVYCQGLDLNRVLLLYIDVICFLMGPSLKSRILKKMLNMTRTRKIGFWKRPKDIIIDAYMNRVIIWVVKWAYEPRMSLWDPKWAHDASGLVEKIAPPGKLEF